MEKVIVNLRQTSDKHTLSIFFLVGTAVLWSFGGLLIKLVSLNPIAIAGTRSAIAALLHLCILRKLRFEWSLARVGGALAYACTSILFVCATQMTTSANAILLQYTAPIYVMVLGMWFLKERPTRVDWIAVAAILGGMLLFFMDDLAPGNLLGNILAIICGICFALTVLLMRFQKDGSPLESVFFGNIITAVVGIPFMFRSAPDARSWVGLVLLGVFQLGLAYVLYSAAIKHVTAIEGILIPVLEPILNPVWVALFLGEVPGKWAVIGGSVVVIAVTLRCVYTSLNAQVKTQDGRKAEAVP